MLGWPKEVWTLLLQCKLVGKAQEVCSALSLQDSLQYDVVKAAIMRAYELVPEAYRQRFRNVRKQASQTHVEFMREKAVLFDKWCSACKVTDFNSLRELILLEEFKNCLPERVVVYLNERSVPTVSQAAVFADEFVLTHKQAFKPAVYQTVGVPSSAGKAVRSAGSPPRSHDERECYYCHKIGHIAGNCLALKKKLGSKRADGSPKPVALVDCGRVLVSEIPVTSLPDPCYSPFVSQGEVSLNAGEAAVPVNILRDTGAAQSLILANTLPFGVDSFCGSYAVCKGLGSDYMKVPLHTVYLASKLLSGLFRIAVCDALPVDGIAVILGNDLAGGKVFPILEILDTPVLDCPEMFEKVSPDVFPACVVTRAQARRFGNEIELSDTFLAGEEKDEGFNALLSKAALGEMKEPGQMLDCGLSRESLIKAQKDDPSLCKYFDMVVDVDSDTDRCAMCYLDNGLLMRKWSAPQNPELHTYRQIIVPVAYRTHILSLAHDAPWSGHLGITKTYNRVLKYFFWPALKRDVVNYCRTCHVCQCTGKPNQVVPPAPLCPIPVMAEPFERVLIDCVGPLPKSKLGNEFLLTIMCTSTRFPEAIPLRKITAPVILRALVKFFSTFGLPKIIQTDQGTNFMSKIFGQVMRTLNVQHVVSSPFRPESQGALERFHQSLKSALRKFCFESGKQWDEGVPMMLFALRESVQESLMFSPAELVFGHTLRGPLKAMQESLMTHSDTVQSKSVLEYVDSFRERLHKAWEIAGETLKSSQGKMKKDHDKRAVSRSFSPGDQVLALLPVPGSCLSARFSGPYVVEKKLSETNYLIGTPDRRKKYRVCHINMLKLYLTRVSEVGDAAPVLVTAAINAQDGGDESYSSNATARVPNSQALKALTASLSHLTPCQRSDIVTLVSDFPTLFSDVPSQTTVLCHEIKVTSDRPIKQHPYRANVRKREVMKQEVEYLLEHGFAKPSVSPWSSPCLVVPKPDGTFRFCTDYRKVNAVTVPDSFPLPRMDDCIDNIGAAQFVTKLDLLKGYWQVPLSPEASDISAFVTPDHFLQYTVMAFGFKNAPATLQRLINQVLGDVPNCSAYLDDAVIFNHDWPSHVSTLRDVFTRLKDASLTLNLAKCVFAQATVSYLGMQVGKGQVRPLGAKVAAIQDFPAPKTRRNLRRFLGMAGYYRRFCKNFSDVVEPLTKLLSPKVEFMWSPACEHAFTSVKILLTEAPILLAPDFGKPFLLEVDASDVGAGAVLLQEDSDGILHPTCYYSHKFNRHQCNYSTIEKEALALILAVQHFEVYVGGSSFPVVVFTDHNPLVFLSRMFNQNQRLMRWALLLQDYQLEVRHKKGVENVVADALSRA
uniref:Gypsy retrotransposon integrase-like protein 1 n=1 Tax=Astyanax mexicanus TaxID=7994 RepID=A0A3B1J3T9_ASTMX